MTNPNAVIVPVAKALETIPESLHFLQGLNLTPKTTAVVLCAGFIATVLNHAMDTGTAIFADLNFRDGRFNFALNRAINEPEEMN